MGGKIRFAARSRFKIRWPEQGILKETAGITRLSRIRQFRLARRNHGVKHIARRGFHDTPFCKDAFNLWIGAARLPSFGQAEYNRNNDETPRLALLEKAVSISKTACSRIEMQGLAGFHIQRAHLEEAFAHFQTVGADILNGRRADCARNQGQVFRPGQPHSSVHCTKSCQRSPAPASINQASASSCTKRRPRCAMSQTMPSKSRVSTILLPPPNIRRGRPLRRGSTRAQASAASHSIACAYRARTSKPKALCARSG